jgi:hypothetical protein
LNEASRGFEQMLNTYQRDASEAPKREWGLACDSIKKGKFAKWHGLSLLRAHLACSPACRNSKWFLHVGGVQIEPQILKANSVPELCWRILKGSIAVAC